MPARIPVCILQKHISISVLVLGCLCLVRINMCALVFRTVLAFESGFKDHTSPSLVSRKLLRGRR